MTVQSISPIMFDGVSMVTAAPKHELGTERNEGGTKYVLAYNCGGSTASVGKAMSRPTSAAAGLYSGSVSSVSGDMPLGFVKHVDIPAGEYGWIVTRGLVSVDTGANASQAVGPKALGAAGLIATLGAGYFAVGEITTAIASGGSGSLLVAIQ